MHTDPPCIHDGTTPHPFGYHKGSLGHAVWPDKLGSHMAELFSSTGYATGMFGKWHIGDTPGRYPTDQGFDEWYGVANTTRVHCAHPSWSVGPIRFLLPVLVMKLYTWLTYCQLLRRWRTTRCQMTESSMESTNSTFLWGSKRSRTERGFIVYNNNVYGYKWRNWKMCTS